MNVSLDGFPECPPVLTFFGDNLPRDPPMQCNFRWCYLINHLEDAAKPYVADMSVDDEVILSDHIDRPGYNPLSAIQGLAFLCHTKGSFEATKANPPSRA